jgi:hypothetical protein
MRLRFIAYALCALPVAPVWASTTESSASPAAASPWRPDHTVIVVLENLSAHDATPAQRDAGNAPVYGHPNWRFVNELADRGAKFTQAHFGRTPYGSTLPARPSQPNYLYLFSGHHQGVLPAWFADPRSPYKGRATRNAQGQPLAMPTDNTRVGVANNSLPDAWLPLTSPNLGAAILKQGGSFASFSESLPYPSWNCATDSALVPCGLANAPTDDYRRKHNPAINWTDQPQPTSPRGLNGDLANHVLAVSVNLGFEPTRDPALKRSFRGFAKDIDGRTLPFGQLPTVSIVVPNEQNDAHSNSGRAADEWLKAKLGAYAQWALKHNSLLIVTFDEDGSTDDGHGDAYQAGTHRIPTIFYGAGIKPGVYERPMDHLNVLSTVLWLHGALDAFKADFRQYHKVVDGSGSESEKEFLNLRPISEPFKRP